MEDIHQEAFVSGAVSEVTGAAVAAPALDPASSTVHDYFTDAIL